MREAIRVAKKGGVTYASYCNSDTAIYSFICEIEDSVELSIHMLDVFRKD